MHSVLKVRVSCVPCAVPCEQVLAERDAVLARKQARLKILLARQQRNAAASAKAHQALRGLDVLTHGAQRALSDRMVSASAIRRGWLGL